jgi:hypothetical protein
MNQKYKKYPRTFHFPFSEGVTSDDKVQHDLSVFKDEIVVTKKMDGENTTMYNDNIHARSIDSKHHPSRDYVKKFHSEIKHHIPENFRICGENLYAKHSIFYENLESYFLVFSIWEDDVCLSWDDTIEYCELLNLKTVPVLFTGQWKKSPEEFHLEMQKTLDFSKDEGYVVRSRNCFHENEFSKKVIKFVRKNHVQTSSHWMTEEICKNLLDCPQI